MLQQVEKSRRSRAAMSQTQKSDLSLSIMLLTVTGVFGLCYLPKLISAVHFLLFKMNVFGANKNTTFELFLSDYSITMAKFHGITVLIESLTVVLNSAVNFAIYCVMGKRFRKSLMSVLCAWIPGREIRGKGRGRMSVSGTRTTTM
jgi:hypothetical protein